VATFDHADRAQASELRDASIFIRDQRIAYIGRKTGCPKTRAVRMKRLMHGTIW
jgi:hypothetical protein